jgi:hypothetical protein
VVTTAVDPAAVVHDRFNRVGSTVSSAFGTIVARSHRTSRSRRATIFLHGKEERYPFTAPPNPPP